MTEAELRNHYHIGTTNGANPMFYRTVYAAGGGRANNHQTGWNGNYGYDDAIDANFAMAAHTHNFQTSATGSSQAMNNMQPYMVVTNAIRV